MKDHKMNFTTNTLTISREFAQKATESPNSRECHITHCRSLCPNLKIAYYTRKNSKTKAYNGLTYKKMEDYIKLYDNADELFKMFTLVKAVLKIQKNKFKYVYNWFVAQFPNYTELPNIRNGKLYTSIVEIPEIKDHTFAMADNGYFPNFV